MNKTKIDHICEKAKDSYFLDRYKFAEYIVRECVDVCKEYGDTDIYGNNITVKKILERFDLKDV